MVHTCGLTFLAALALLELLSVANAHGHDNNAAEAMETGAAAHTSTSSSMLSAAMNSTTSSPQSYFIYPEMSGVMLAHIVVMTIAWVFILPIGVMLSIARSRLALIVQLSFLGVHGIGLLLAAVYRQHVPDLYEYNSHHRIGWVATWVVLAQIVIGLLKIAARLGKSHRSIPEEQAAFLPVTTQALEEHQQLQSPDAYRYSRDSGHFTASETSRTQSISSSSDQTQEEQRKLQEYEAAHEAEGQDFEKGGLLGNPKVERFAMSIANMVSKRTLRILDVIYNLIDRTIFLLAFITIVTGIVVYGGVFRGHMIFSGLAHTIKGGIFFWYGLLTLGRWMGCFAEYGWAWNVRPPVGVVSSRQAALPSAEFIESFVIFVYGTTNVFLEHLAAWGLAWSPGDLEHVSISTMFFGGGLCGMLIESSRVRELLNTVILTSPAAHLSPSTREHLNPPKSYPFSLNPIPALIILLLGLLMSSHEQELMVSTMMHKLWGTLFVGFAMARAITYILTYISPPTSYLPSRPPSELIASFCLISGGLLFMSSSLDTVKAMDKRHLHAMFPFTVTMGFTAFLMAWAIITLVIKGWAIRRSQSTHLHPVVAA